MNKRFFVPEVVQTSEMDCGPASLKAMLEGFGISVSYGRLREACQTSVDGTSIDTLEEIAVALGLEAEQVMLPADHLFLPETQALPAIVVVRLPNGLTHFMVVWSRHGKFLQVMDPGKGRRWVTQRHFLDELFIHRFPVPAASWREWAGTEGFLNPLRARAQQLKIALTKINQLIEESLNDPGWMRLAALDAAVRMTDAVVKGKGVLPGDEAALIIDQLYHDTLQPPDDLREKSQPLIPSNYWSVLPLDLETDVSESLDRVVENLLLVGAVLVRVSGLRQEAPVSEVVLEAEAQAETLSVELQTALQEPPAKPFTKIWEAIKEDGLTAPLAVFFSFVLVSLALLVQGVLFQGLMNFNLLVNPDQNRLPALVALLVFLSGVFLIEFPLTSIMQRISRHLENHLRVAFLKKIPRLSDRYFHSRLTSDMTTRVHELSRLRILATLGASLLQTVFQLGLTTAGIIWLNPQSAPLAIGAAIFFVLLTLLFNPIQQETDMRLQVHNGALSRFYLDALLGLMPLRAHSAERAFRRQHEGLLVEWVRANIDAIRVSVVYQAAESLAYSAFSVWLIWNNIQHQQISGSSLLLLYWTLSLPALGQALIQHIKMYPMLRNSILRLMEVLQAPEEILPESMEEIPALPGDGQMAGLEVAFEHVTVLAGGHAILRNIHFGLQAGEHVAIVGSSGAGKTSLVGLLLGWHTPVEGQCLVDGIGLSKESLHALRRVIAWVDPSVQLWNRTVLENLQYGNEQGNNVSLEHAITHADLYGVIQRLENGMQTCLGEGGGLVSGGEGQRIRLGRALNRPGVRLVILDEPFRGLDRDKRRQLLTIAREYWKDATLICVTHDVGETQSFDRVLVIEDGQIIEDAPPSRLVRKRSGRYAALLKAEHQVRRGLWEATEWRKWWLENGKITEQNQ